MDSTYLSIFANRRDIFGVTDCEARYSEGEQQLSRLPGLPTLPCDRKMISTQGVQRTQRKALRTEPMSKRLNRCVLLLPHSELCALSVLCGEPPFAKDSARCECATRLP